MQQLVRADFLLSGAVRKHAALANVQRADQYSANVLPVIRELSLPSRRWRAACCDVPLPYDKTLIAGQLGLKPESLSLTFAKLRSLGVAVHASRVGVSDIITMRDCDQGGEKAIAASAAQPPRQPGSDWKGR